MATPDTHSLSYRDEEIVIRARSGETPEVTAQTLGHSLGVVLAAYSRAGVLGIPLGRAEATRPVTANLRTA